ncbi:MAG: hypothetical protein Q8R07_01535, partial [Candidatus Uhrbacteria bacterium]|nr:hypothetical protein [Candidatus Uhrbacteria bacterium]
MGAGDVEELLAADPPAQAGDAAAAQGDKQLEDVEAVALRVGLRRDEGGYPVQPVVLHQDHEVADGDAAHHEERQVAQRRPGDEEQRARREDDDDSGAHVRLHDHQAADHAHHHHERHEAQAELADVLAASGQPGGDVDDDGQLGELAGLERERAELQPAPGAVALDADSRN